MAGADGRLRRGAYHALVTARRFQPTADRAGRRARATLFAGRAALLARWRDAVVVADIAPDADIGRLVLDVWPYTTTYLRIGSRAQVHDGVRLSLRGGRLDIGARADVRRNVTMHVGGELVIGEDAMISTGVCLHCAKRLDIGALTLVSEYSTVTDSWHRRTPPGVAIQHAVSTAPTRIGDNVWIGARVTVAAGVRVGNQCIVGSGAVVTSDIEAGWLAAGVPARPIRLLDEE